MLAVGLKHTVSARKYVRDYATVPLYFRHGTAGQNLSVDTLANWYTDVARTVQASALPNKNNICYFGLPADGNSTRTYNVIAGTLIARAAHIYSGILLSGADASKTQCHFYHVSAVRGTSKIGNGSKFFNNSSYGIEYNSSWKPSYVEFKNNSLHIKGTLGYCCRFYDYATVNNSDSYTNSYQAVGDNASFYGQSSIVQAWSIGHYARFYDTAYVTGISNLITIGDYAFFNNCDNNVTLCIAQNCAIGNYATFTSPIAYEGLPNAQYLNQSIGGAYVGVTIGHHATFNRYSNIANSNTTIGHHATFNDHTNANGIIGDYATFNHYCSIIGYEFRCIGDYATFNDSTYTDNYNAATIGDYATFNDYSNTWIPVGNGATFNDLSVLDSGWYTHINGDIYLNDNAEIFSANVFGNVHYNMHSGGKAYIRGKVIRYDRIWLQNPSNPPTPTPRAINGLVESNGYKRIGSDGIEITQWNIYDECSIGLNDIPYTFNLYDHSYAFNVPSDFSLTLSNGTYNFYDRSYNNGEVATAIFYNYTTNEGIVWDNATFYDRSYNNNTIGSAHFYNYSYNSNYAILNDISSFYDYSYNAGISNNESNFYNYSFNIGAAAGGYTSLFNHSYNAGIIDNGNGNFYDYSYNAEAGICYFDTYFNGNSVNYGSIDSGVIAFFNGYSSNASNEPVGAGSYYFFNEYSHNDVPLTNKSQIEFRGSSYNTGTIASSNASIIFYQPAYNTGILDASNNNVQAYYNTLPYNLGGIIIHPELIGYTPN